MKKLTFIFLLLTSFYGFSKNWKPTYQEAFAISKTEDKILLLVFSGTDRCATCIKLEKQTLASKKFIDQDNKDDKLYRADFPKKKSKPFVSRY